jgi:hypothetical protein
MSCCRSRCVGGDHAHVHGNRVGGADRADVVLLQDAQQLHLQAHRHVADLVEQQRAAVGGLEQALVIAHRAGERTLDVAEQLDSSRFSAMAEQLMATNGLPRRGLALWMARASNSLPVPDSPVISTRASVPATMCACESFLFDERAARDDLRAPVLVRIHEARDAQRLLHLVEQFLLVDRLGEEAERAELRGMHGVGNGAVGRQDDDLEPG